MNAELQQYVTVARIEPANIKSIKAFASIRIGVFLVHGLRVIQKDDGSLWVALPKEKKDESYVPVVKVTNREFMQLITRAVLSAYKNETSKQQMLDLLGVGEQTMQRAWAKKRRGTAQKDKRFVYRDCPLPDEDVSNVGK